MAGVLARGTEMASKLTAETWDAARTPRRLLEHVGGKLRRRRRLLLVHACCQRLVPVLTTPGSLEPLTAVERLVDDPDLLSAEVKRARRAVIVAFRDLLSHLDLSGPPVGGTPAVRGNALAIQAINLAVHCVTNQDIRGVFEVVVRAIEEAGCRS